MILLVVVVAVVVPCYEIIPFYLSHRLSSLPPLQFVIMDYSSVLCATGHPLDAANYLLLLRPLDAITNAMVKLLCQARDYLHLSHHLLNRTYTFYWGKDRDQYTWDKGVAQVVMKRAAALLHRIGHRSRAAVDLYKAAEDYSMAMRVVTDQLCACLALTRHDRQHWVHEARGLLNAR